MQRTWVEVGRCLLVQLSGDCLQTERRPVLITEPAIALQGVQVLRPIGLYFFAVEFFFAQLVIKGFDHLADDFFCGFHMEQDAIGRAIVGESLAGGLGGRGERGGALGQVEYIAMSVIAHKGGLHRVHQRVFACVRR